MDWVTKELPSLLQYLLPGFLAAWIFYGLTAHPKKEAFERVVQALIFTVVVQFVVICLRWLFLLCGRVAAVGHWTNDSMVFWSVVVASGVGVGFSYLANSNWIHARLQSLEVTKRTSYPSEWYSAFHHHKRYIVLNMKNGRRIRGWPDEWPDQSDKGHFLLEHPAWVSDDGQHIPLHQIKRMLIPALDVEMVEIEKDDNEKASISGEQLATDQQPLLDMHKEKQDEHQATGASTAATDKSAA